MKRKKKKRAVDASDQGSAPNQTDGEANQEVNPSKLTARDEATLKMITCGGVIYGKRLAHIKKDPDLAICPYCDLEEVETAEHLWWRCPRWEEWRRPIRRITTDEDRAAWPPCTRQCGVWVGKYLSLIHISEPTRPY